MQTISEIQTEIAAEHQRVENANTAIANLRAQRDSALLAGNDKEAAAADDTIAEHTGKMQRSHDRIALLESKATELAEREREAELDALASRAKHVSALGQKLIREDYARLATELAKVLRRIDAAETFVTDANVRLQRGQRPAVPECNRARCRASRNWTETVRQRVGIGDSRHPMHGVAIRDPHPGSPWRDPKTGARVEPFVEMDLPIVRTEAGDYPSPLPRTVVLPNFDPTNSSPVWPSNAPMNLPIAIAELDDSKPGGILGFLKSKAA